MNQLNRPLQGKFGTNLSFLPQERLVEQDIELENFGNPKIAFEDSHP